MSKNLALSSINPLVGRSEIATGFLLRQNVLFILACTMFWLCLFLGGFPQPMVDDLFYTGAAANLSQNGEFFNPLLANWASQTVDRFFVYPPFHTYVLAGWILIFGVNTLSYLLFQAVCYILFSIFTAFTLRRYCLSWLSVAGVILAYAMWMAKMGLRPDALGMAFLAIGVWFLLTDSVLFYVLGFTFVGCAICTSPILMVYGSTFGALPLVLNFMAEYQREQHISSRYIVNRIASLMVAVGLVFFLLLWAVNFELAHFLSDLSWHSSLRVPTKNNIIPTFLLFLRNGYGEIIYGPLYLVFVGLSVLTLMSQKQASKKLKVFLITLIFALTLNVVAYTNTVETNFSFFCWLGIAVLLFNLSLNSTVKLGLCGLTFVAFLTFHSQLLIAWMTQDQPNEAQYQVVADWVEAHPEFDYAVDFIAARFVFDYTLPPRSTAWVFQHAGVEGPESLAKKPANVVWLIAPVRAHQTEGLADYERVELFGRQFGSIPKSPYNVVIVE